MNSCLPVRLPLRAWLLVAGVAGIALFFLAQDLAGRWLSTLMLHAPGGDKVFHCLEFLAVYLVLDYLWGLASARGRRRCWLAVASALAVAVADETLQGLTSSRNVEFYDVVANLCGIGLGVALRQPDWPASRRVLIAAGALLATGGLAADSYSTLKDFNEGLLYEREHEFGLARRAYLRALSSGYESAGLYNSLGWVEIESGEGTPAKAVEYAGEALALRPGDADVLDTYGWALHHAGRHAEALGYLLRAYEKSPKMFCIHYHLAMVKLALGRRDEAAEHFSEQLRMAPEADESRRAREELQRPNRRR